MRQVKNVNVLCYSHPNNMSLQCITLSNYFDSPFISVRETLDWGAVYVMEASWIFLSRGLRCDLPSKELRMNCSSFSRKSFFQRLILSMFTQFSWIHERFSENISIFVFWSKSLMLQFFEIVHGLFHSHHTE